MIVWNRGRIIAASLGLATLLIGVGLTIAILHGSFNAPAIPPYKADPEEQRLQLVAVSAPYADCVKSNINERWRTATDINETSKDIIKTCRKEFEVVRAVQRQNIKNGPNPREASREDEEQLLAFAATTVSIVLAEQRCADNLPTPQANCNLFRPRNKSRQQTP